MNIFIAALLLGVVQGVTEFLPVSSTSHLIIFEKFIGFDESLSLSFDVAVHFATALAVVWYFRQEWKRIIFAFFSKNVDMKENILPLLLIGTIPAGLVGIYFEGLVTHYLRTIEFVIVGLILGNILIIVSENLCKRTSRFSSSITVWESLIIGVFQAAALLPGISRSGATISAGLLLNKDHSTATRFSFLLATPIIIGASIKKFIDSPFIFTQDIMPVFIIGFVAAFVSGLFALTFITHMMKRSTLYPFVYYRFALAGVLLLFLILL